MQGQQEAKEMRNFLAKYGGDRLRKVFWQMVKGEHPDAIMLRLLRARKWNIDRAVAVLGSTAAWRVENNVEEINRGGELVLTSTRGGFNVLNNGVSYMYGATPNGEPVYIIEVGNHFSSSQTQDELQRAVILLQETLGSLMPPPVERKVVIFNMNNFGIRNMDWWCVFFMVKTMELFYVETLARVYVHGAPWIFKPIWSILKPLLDPVVRDKIRLTSDAKELEEYIPWDHLPKDTMKGGMNWEFQYPHPQPGENDEQKDTVTRDRLQEDYFGVCFELERATKAVARCLFKAATRRGGTSATGYNRHSLHPPWQDADDAASIVGGQEYDEPPELAGLKAHRDVMATQLRVAWLRLRPYVVGKTKMDRWDVIQRDGTVLWRYPKLDGTVETELLGEATSLPALERSLAAIERSASGAVSDDGDDERDEYDDADDDFDDAVAHSHSDDSAGSNRKHGTGAAAVPNGTENSGNVSSPSSSKVLPDGSNLSKTASAGSGSVMTADSRLSADRTLRQMNGNKKGERRRSSGAGSAIERRRSSGAGSASERRRSSGAGSVSANGSSRTANGVGAVASARPTTSTSTISEASSRNSRPSTFGTAKQVQDEAGSSRTGARGSYGSDLLTPATSVEDGGGNGGRKSDVERESAAAAAAAREVPVHPLSAGV